MLDSTLAPITNRDQTTVNSSDTTKTPSHLQVLLSKDNNEVYYTPRQALTCWKTWHLLTMYFFSSCYGVYVAASFKSYGTADSG